MDYSRWHAHGSCAGGDVGQHHGIGPNPRAVSNSDASQDFCAGAYANVVANDWRYGFVPTNSNRNVLINPNVVANYATVVQNSTHAIVPKMYIYPADPCLVGDKAAKYESKELLDQKGEDRNFPAV